MDKCRVCGGPLYGWYGLCYAHLVMTFAFWDRLRANIERRQGEQVSAMATVKSSQS